MKASVNDPDILRLAIVGANEQHRQALHYSYGSDHTDGHQRGGDYEIGFATCPHPDCKRVREGAQDAR